MKGNACWLPLWGVSWSRSGWFCTCLSHQIIDCARSRRLACLAQPSKYGRLKGIRLSTGVLVRGNNGWSFIFKSFSTSKCASFCRSLCCFCRCFVAPCFILFSLFALHASHALCVTFTAGVCGVGARLGWSMVSRVHERKRKRESPNANRSLSKMSGAARATGKKRCRSLQTCYNRLTNVLVEFWMHFCWIFLSRIKISGRSCTAQQRRTNMKNMM